MKKTTKKKTKKKEGIIFKGTEENLLDQIEDLDKQNSLLTEKKIKKELDLKISRFSELMNSFVEEKELKELNKAISSLSFKPSIVLIESILKELVREKEELRVDILPEYLRQLGLIGLKDRNGNEISITRIVSGKVEDVKKFLSWAKKNKYDDMVKTTIELSYSSYDKKLKTFLIENEYDSKISENSIHGKTLNSLLSNIVKDLDKKEIDYKKELGKSLPALDAVNIKILDVIKFKENKL